MTYHDVEVVLVALVVQFGYPIGLTQSLVHLPFIWSPTGCAAFAGHMLKFQSHLLSRYAFSAFGKDLAVVYATLQNVT